MLCLFVRFVLNERNNNASAKGDFAKNKRREFMWNKKQESSVKSDDIQLFTYYDSKSKVYGSIIPAINQHTLLCELMNMFRDVERRKDNMLFKNSEDYSVFRIGYYDKFEGSVIPCAPEHVANLHELRASVLADEERSLQASSVVGITGT